MTNDEIQEILLEEFGKLKEIKSFKDWEKVTENLLESLKNIDLSQYTDNPTHLLEKLEDDILEDGNLKGGVCELNNIVKEKIISDIHLVEITSFYPTIIKQLMESKILDTDENFNKVFLTIYYFRQNNRRTKLNDTSKGVISIYSGHFHTFYKIWINWVFGILYKIHLTTSTYNFNNTINITMYTRDIFNKIIKELTWVYVDTDQIFCYIKDKEHVKEIFNKHNLSCNIGTSGYAYFKSIKKYLYTDGKGNISSRGIKYGNEIDVENELKIRYRNDEINKVLL